MKLIFMRNPSTLFFRTFILLIIPILIFSIKGFSQNSVLSTGDWIKIGITENGIYCLTRNDLVAAGISVSSIDPRNIAIFGNPSGMLSVKNNVPPTNDLQELAITVKGESDGTFDQGDSISFFGQSQIKWKPDSLQHFFFHTNNIYSDTTFYFLTILTRPGKRIQATASLPANNTTSVSFTDYAVHETDIVNFLHSGKEWFGEQFDSQFQPGRLFSFNVSEISANEPLYFHCQLLGRSFNDSSTFTLNSNNADTSVNIKRINSSFFDSTALVRKLDLVVQPPVNNGDLLISYSCNDTAAKGWLDYIELNFIRNLKVYSPIFYFRDLRTVGAGNVTNYTIDSASSAATIYDITDPINVTIQEYTFIGNSIKFNAQSDVLHEYLYYQTGTAIEPLSFYRIDNQNLHASGFAKMIIITGDEFINEANTLCSFHQSNDGLSCMVVPVSKIYNEYSTGVKDISGIRDFIKQVYNNALFSNDSLKYILLFGGGDYDYKNHSGISKDIIPTYESDQSLLFLTSYCTDDFYGFLDPWESDKFNDTVDIAIGRIPAANTGDAMVINKIMNYSSPASFGGWRTKVIAVADDQDYNTHFNQMEHIVDSLDNAGCNFNFRKIYLDAYVQQADSLTGAPRYPMAKNDIITNIDQGSLVVEYIGHGSALGWASERVLDSLSLLNAPNTNRLPLYLAITAEWNMFDNPSRRSCGQIVALNSTSAGIASIGSTRVGFSSSNYSFNKFLHKYLLQKENGHGLMIGDILKKTKQSYFDPYVVPFCLLGDPAVRLNIPANKVVLSMFNGSPVSTNIDTLIPGQSLSIQGRIEDDNGTVLTSFNGTVDAVLYDQATLHYTLANDTLFDISIVAPFYQYDDTLHSNTYPVVNGEFSATFNVPSDIDSGSGIGRLNFYAQSNSTDGFGCYNKFVYRNLTLEINEHNKKINLVVSPNPVLDKFEVQLDKTSLKNLLFTICTVEGKNLTEIKVSSSHFIVYRGGVAPGIYIYRLANEKNEVISTGRLIFE